MKALETHELRPLYVCKVCGSPMIGLEPMPALRGIRWGEVGPAWKSGVCDPCADSKPRGMNFTEEEVLRVYGDQLKMKHYACGVYQI